MKYLNMTLVVVLALSFTTNAKADFADPVIFSTKIRVSIIGHTGQDPVNRSFAEELTISIPTFKSKFVQQIMKSGLSPFLVSDVTQSNNWSSRFTSRQDWNLTNNCMSSMNWKDNSTILNRFFICYQATTFLLPLHFYWW